jgi:hypothetical protein
LPSIVPALARDDLPRTGANSIDYSRMSMRSSFVAALLVLTACAGSGRFDTANDAGDPDGHMPPQADGPRPQPNISFETAHVLHDGDAPWLQDERSAEQVDYYVFSGKAGEVYEVTTDAGQFSPDNVLSLYDAKHDLIARNDNGNRWPGDGIDARLVVRLPRSGDYYVTVEDLVTPPEFFASSLPLLFYHVLVRKLQTGSTGVAIRDGDATTAFELAEDATTGYRYATVITQVGAAEHSFEFTGHAGLALLGNVADSGAQGNGSTAADGELRIGDGQGLVARIDRAQGQHNIDPPMADGRYRLTFGVVTDPGENPFRVVELLMGPENPAEQHDASNGKRSGAEPIQFMGSGYRGGFLLAHLPTGDVDYFRFDVAENEQVSVSCEAESSGSGVRGLHAELRDATDKAMASADETTGQSLELPRTAIAKAGTIYLRLSSERASADGVEPWARCRTEVGP